MDIKITLQAFSWLPWFSHEPREAPRPQEPCLPRGTRTRRPAGGITRLTGRNKDKKPHTIRNYPENSEQTQPREIWNPGSVEMTLAPDHFIQPSLDNFTIQFLFFLTHIVKEPVITKTWVVASIPRSWLPSNWWVETWWLWTHSLYNKKTQQNFEFKMWRKSPCSSFTPVSAECASHKTVIFPQS